MPRPLARAWILLLLVILLATPAMSGKATASVPVMHGKLLLYSWPDYITVLFMYNDTSVIITNVGSSGNTVIISYDPATNTLKVSSGQRIGVCDSSEEEKGYILPLMLAGGPFAFQGGSIPVFVLPKSLLENVENIISTGHVNFVETYFDGSRGEWGEWVTNTCTLPVNTTLFSVETGSYMGQEAVVVTSPLIPSIFGSDVPLNQVTPAKTYWRPDGTLLAIELGNGTTIVKLVAEDDLGLKKTGENQQPTGGAGSSEGSATSTTTSSYPGSKTRSSTIQSSPSSSQTVGNTGQVTTPKPESPETTSSISTPGKPSAGLPNSTVAIIALIAIVAALVIIVKRK